MKILVFLCLLGLLSPVAVWATTITAYSHLEEHISVLNKTDFQEASSGQIISSVMSDVLPEHYLQGNTSAQAHANGSLRVSAVGTTDLYDGVSTYFTSTASWSENYLNDDAGRHYQFNFDTSDIDIGSDYRAGSANRTGYEVDVFLNNTLVYNQSFIFDTTTLANEYVTAMMSGDPNPPPGETYFSIAGIAGSVDLGDFALNEAFTLKYQITAFAQPIDSSSCYINFGMSGNLVTDVTPVPEPATLLLLGSGLGSLTVIGNVRRRRKNK